MPQGSVIYDDHENTLGLGAQQQYLFDSSDRLYASYAGNEVNYTHDPLDRIFARIEFAGESSSQQNLRYIDHGDAPDMLTGTSGDILERYLYLPGGV